MEVIPAALAHILTFKGMLLLLFATAVGSAAAILPGISPPTMMALLLPLTFGMDKYEAFMFMAALLAAGGFAGSMTSILLNVPGDGINAATCLDGFPLARQGKAGVAIGASATASGLGALFGLVILVLSFRLVRPIVLSFGPPEFFALSMAGVALIGTVSTRAPLKGLTAGLLGMALGFIGVNTTLGGTRYTFEIIELYDGIRLIPAVIGLFALPELFQLLREDVAVSAQGFTVKGGVLQGVLEVLKRPGLFFRSASIGTLLGFIPGAGSVLASWVSYFAAMNSSRHPETFGSGNIEGVIAPEATIDAKESASMLPVFALGLPAGISTAILLSAFQLHGIYPGQRLFQQDLPLIWVILLAMVFSNLMTSALGLIFANAMVRLTLVPAVVISPIILVLGAVGSYADQQSMFGVSLMMFFGLLGLVMVQLGYPRPPLLVGMILLPLAEQNFHLSLQIHRGSYEFLLRPLTLGILLVTFLAVALFSLRRLRSHQQNDRPATMQAHGGSAAPLTELFGAAPRGSLSAAVFAVLLLLFAGALLVESFRLSSGAALFPRIVLAPLAGLLLWLVAGAALDRWKLRRSHAAELSRRDKQKRSSGWIALWVLALPLLMSVVGIIPAVGLYTTVFVLGFARQAFSARRFVWSVVGGCGLMLATHYVFVQGLGVRFHRGIIG